MFFGKSQYFLSYLPLLLLQIPSTLYSGVVWRQDCETLEWHSRTLTLDNRRLVCTDLDRLDNDATETFLLAHVTDVCLAMHNGDGDSDVSQVRC